MSKLKNAVPPLILLSILVAAWWWIVVATKSLILPTPWAVVSGTFELAKDGSLWTHIGYSLMRVGVGFLLALSLAIPLGLCMGRVQAVHITLNPLVQLLRPISPIAWIPLAILWFGVGDASPIFLIFIASLFPVMVQTAAGVQTIEQRYLRAANNFAVPRYKLYRQVIIPAVLPDLVVGMRISLGIAWLVVVAAEMITPHSGLGFLIMDARNAGNRYDLVIGAMIMIGIIGLLLDVLMRLLEKLESVRWRYGQ